MLTKNLLHQAVLAGHSALFITASDLPLDLNGQDTSRARSRSSTGSRTIAKIIPIEGESYRKREAELTQKTRRGTA